MKEGRESSFGVGLGGGKEKKRKKEKRERFAGKLKKADIIIISLAERREAAERGRREGRKPEEVDLLSVAAGEYLFLTLRR